MNRNIVSAITMLGFACYSTASQARPPITWFECNAAYVDPDAVHFEVTSWETGTITCVEGDVVSITAILTQKKGSGGFSDPVNALWFGTVNSLTCTGTRQPFTALNTQGEHEIVPGPAELSCQAFDFDTGYQTPCRQSRTR